MDFITALKSLSEKPEFQAMVRGNDYPTRGFYIEGEINKNAYVVFWPKNFSVNDLLAQDFRPEKI